MAYSMPLATPGSYERRGNMPATDNEAEEIFQFLPLREGELQIARSGLPVDAILGGDAAGLMVGGLAAGLGRRLRGRLGLGRRRRLSFRRRRGGRSRGRGGGGRSGRLDRSRSRGRGSGGRLHLDRGSVTG